MSLQILHAPTVAQLPRCSDQTPSKFPRAFPTALLPTPSSSHSDSHGRWVPSVTSFLFLHYTLYLEKCVMFIAHVAYKHTIITHKDSGCGYLAVLVGWEKSHPLGWNIIVSSVWNSETFHFTAISKCEIGEMRLESPVRSHLRPFTSSAICKAAGRCGGMRFCSNLVDFLFHVSGNFFADYRSVTHRFQRWSVRR